MKTKSTYTSSTFALLATVGMVFTGCSLNFKMVDGYMFTNTGETAQATEEGKFSEGISAIDVVNKFGNVKIELAVGEPGWKWDSKVWADSQELADQLIDELAMDVQTHGNTQTWNVVLPEPTSDLNGVQSNLTLMVPAEVKAKLDNSHGDVSIARVYADVDLVNRHGNVELTELQGIVKARNEHGNLVASQIGEATIDVSHGNTEVLSATGKVTISGSHGKIKAEKIAGELSIDASHTQVMVDQVDSSGDLKTSHGDIIATHLAGDVQARNSHGSIKITTSGEYVSIKAEHGQIDLSMVSSNFKSIDLETSHDSIKVHLPANVYPEVDMKASHGDAKSEFESSDDAEQKVKLRTSHGNIRVMKQAAVVESVQ